MKLPRIELRPLVENPLGGEDYAVLLDGKDISQYVTDVTITVSIHDLPRVELRLIAGISAEAVFGQAKGVGPE